MGIVLITGNFELKSHALGAYGPGDPARGQSAFSSREESSPQTYFPNIRGANYKTESMERVIYPPIQVQLPCPHTKMVVLANRAKSLNQHSPRTD